LLPKDQQLDSLNSALSIQCSFSKNHCHVGTVNIKSINHDDDDNDDNDDDNDAIVQQATGATYRLAEELIAACIPAC